MSAMMIATTALIIASTAHNSGSGGGSNCPVSDFGGMCVGIFFLMMILSGASLVAAFTRNWDSKWGDRWFFASIVILILSFVPITVGLIHDCQ